MSRASRNRKRARRAAALGAGVSLAVHVAALALVDIRLPAVPSRGDAVNLVASPMIHPTTERAEPAEVRPEELRLVRADASTVARTEYAAPPAGAASAVPAVRVGGGAGPVPARVHDAGSAVLYQPLQVIHPATGGATVAHAGIMPFSQSIVPASRTGSHAPPLYERGAVGDAKQRWADAAGFGAPGAGLRIGFGGGACGIPGRGPVTSWF